MKMKYYLLIIFMTVLTILGCFGDEAKTDEEVNKILSLVLQRSYKDGGGWEKCYKETPKAHGNTTVSIPVYDKKTGIVLVYMGTQSHWLAGSGWIIAYEYKEGKLKEMKRVMLWIS
jgi:hypothetical protein